MINKLRQHLVNNLKNMPGWRTNRKLIIIECDDWGGIRMPSKAVFDELNNKGLPVNTSRFNRYDTLANKEDFDQLFTVLKSVKAKNGNHPVITAMTNMANPDFEKIKKSGFASYYSEDFTTTLDRYYPGQKVFDKWEEGIKEGIFVPELHGKEHISVQHWMKHLKSGHPELLKAFNHGFVAFGINDLPDILKEFRPEFYFDNDEQKPFLINSIRESVELFEKTFGYLPRVFTPSNGLFHPDLDHEVASNGIRYLYVTRKMPYPATNGEIKFRPFTTGQRGPEGLIYYTRNCAFEPTDPEYMGVEFTLSQIEAAFRWGKPANISTHRANFTGSINPDNREIGLNELKKLLDTIVKRWPDVEFLSSGDAFDIMRRN
nr:hypothetical protein [uncultured Carboxylicivirga sp.]